MKNIFDYATKELSQDAFLMWLFENYNCENRDVSNASKSIIHLLTGIDTSKITDVWTKPQWCKIDITVFITLDNKERVALFIEDKVYSGQHDNQLKRYNGYIDRILNYKENRGHFIKTVKTYYKPQAVSEEEVEGIKDAGWSVLTFEQIKNFWANYTNADNEILSQYALHIQKMWETFTNTKKPNDNDQYAWISYFERVVEPQLRDKYTNITIEINTTRYKYSVLKIRPADLPHEIPFLEVRSRDCCDDRFLSKILMYDVPRDTDQKPLGLRSMHSIVQKYDGTIFTGQYSEKQNKQVAHSIKDESNTNIVSDINFFEALCRDIDEYLQIIYEWHTANKNIYSNKN